MKDPRQLQMEAVVRMVGQSLGQELEDTTTGPKMGFMLMVFDFGDGGFSAYISNAEREDMIKLLREQANRLEIGADDVTARA